MSPRQLRALHANSVLKRRTDSIESVERGRAGSTGRRPADLLYARLRSNLRASFDQPLCFARSPNAATLRISLYR